MDYLELAKRLEGLQTVSTIAKKLGITKRTAVNYVSKLRKEGFLKNYMGGRKTRFYVIDPLKRKETGYPGIYEIINKNSRIGLVTRVKYRVHGKPLSIEEVIVEAIKTNDYRVILASLDLFRKVKDWSKLKDLAIKNKIGRKIGALYDVARKFIRVRRMDLRTRTALLNSKINNRYIIQNLRGELEHFKDIEVTWRVYIPFNKNDLMRYKE
ncbi:MAG: HTH domain-containing protein [Nanoarchaeota archaeon]